MTIFAIILNYKSYQDTILLIEDLKQQQKVDLNIIVVDNKSPNESFQILSQKFENDKYVTVIDSGYNGGYSYGNNVGLKYIDQFNPEFAVVLNNDVRIADHLLFYNLSKEFKEKENVFVVSPMMLQHGKENLTAWRVPSIWVSIITASRLGYKKVKAKLMYYQYNQDLKNEEVDCLNGSFQFFDYPKFKSIDFYDDGIFLFEEETILGYKVKQAGGTSLLCKKYTYEHFCAKTIDATINYIEKLKMIQKSRLYFHKMYTTKSSFLIFLLKCAFKWRIVEERIIFFLRKRLGRI